jgi:hypothetical protein
MEDNTEKTDKTIFDNFTINDLFKKIYLNHHAKEEKITELSEDMEALIVDSTSAILVGPIVQSLTDSSIKNDDLLIKLANIATKTIEGPKINTTGFDEIVPMSKKEKNELLEKMNELSVDFENN